VSDGGCCELSCPGPLEIPGYGVSRYLGGSAAAASSNLTSPPAECATSPTSGSLSPGWPRLRASSGADICFGGSGPPSILSGTNLVLGITAVEPSLAGSDRESGPWEQRVDTPAARAFLSQYVRLP
jgi:hypothetical protein